MVLYFIATVFLSATLLFSMQPMVAKTLLPVFGGSSSVWTTCMLFYQTVLLLGYLYAHFVMKRVPRRVQLIGHVSMLIVALTAGYMFDTPVAPAEASVFPVPWLILQLALVSGLPFFMISSAGPLVQGWFARTGHGRSHDPYFLYAASNGGSLIGLLAYPFVIEPMLGLDTQRSVWLGGFGVFIVLSAGAILMTRKGHTEDPHAPPGDVLAPVESGDQSRGSDRPIDWGRRLRWVFYAFVPSSMLLGVTSHISMDIASFPLLWVLPLAVYLITMIVAFAVDAHKLVESIRRPLVMAVIGATILVLASDAQAYAPIKALVAVQLLVLGVVGLMGHGLLSRDRPGASHLTEFYLMMSIGGALGGLFNGVVAPLVFETTLEYQIALVCTAALLPWRRIGEIADAKFKRRAMLVRFGLPVLSVAYLLFMGFFAGDILRFLGVGLVNELTLGFGLMIFVPALLIYLAWKDGLACGLVLIVPLMGAAYDDLTDPKIQHRERTFYGVLSVVNEPYFDPIIEQHVVIRKLLHGTTDHGVEYIGPDNQGVPLGYYHPQGPCGTAINGIQSLHPDGMRMGAVGLGTGAISAYNRPTDLIRYFEIDPGVAEIAENPEYFGYLSGAQGRVEVVLGDGRLLLEEELRAGESVYDMLVIDAFSSDSIPVHLLTYEAIGLYFDRLASDGVILLHISNRHLDLHPLLFELGTAHQAAVLYQDQFDNEIEEGRRAYWLQSTWMVLTKDPQAAQVLFENGMQKMMFPETEVRMWTDQYSNILSLFNK